MNTDPFIPGHGEPPDEARGPDLAAIPDNQSPSKGTMRRIVPPVAGADEAWAELGFYVGVGEPIPLDTFADARSRIEAAILHDAREELRREQMDHEETREALRDARERGLDVELLARAELAPRLWDDVSEAVRQQTLDWARRTAAEYAALASRVPGEDAGS